MASPDLAQDLDELVAFVEGPAPAAAAARAMEEEWRRATARYIGGDLTMSGLRAGPVSFDATTGAGTATVRAMGGTYGLADGGRRRAVRQVAPKGRPFATPWGPRMTVKGSTWRGFDITDSASEGILDEGDDAGWEAIEGEV